MGSSPFGRPYSGNPCWFLLLPLLRCFRWGGSRSVLPTRGFPSATGFSPAAGGPIRRSPDQSLHAATRGVSPLATAFVGARAEPSTGRLTCCPWTTGTVCAPPLTRRSQSPPAGARGAHALRPGALGSGTASTPGQRNIEGVRAGRDSLPPTGSKGGDPAAGSPTATLLRLLPPWVERRAVCARSRDVFTARW